MNNPSFRGSEIHSAPGNNIDQVNSSLYGKETAEDTAKRSGQESTSFDKFDQEDAADYTSTKN
jgi:hypothetical protein